MKPECRKERTTAGLLGTDKTKIDIAHATGLFSCTSFLKSRHNKPLSGSWRVHCVIGSNDRRSLSIMRHRGRPNSSVGSMFSSDELDTSATQVRISLALLAKNRILKNYQIVPAQWIESPSRLHWFHSVFPS